MLILIVSGGKLNKKWTIESKVIIQTHYKEAKWIRTQAILRECESEVGERER